MKFSIKEGRDFGWEGLKAKAVSSKDDFKNASMAYFEVTGSHGKDDVIIVPKNTPYDYWATDSSTLKLYLVHTPAYDPDFERKLS